MKAKIKHLLSSFEYDQSPLKFSPKRLQEEYEAVRSKYEEGDLLPPVDLSKLTKKVERDVIQGKKEVENVLSERDLRFVPYLAFQGDPLFIKNDSFYKYCRSQIKSINKSSLISIWLHNLLKYKGSDSYNVKHMFDLFEEQLKKYDGKSRRVNIWKQNSELILSSEKKAASHILNQGKSLKEFLVEHKLSSELNESDYAAAIIKIMVSRCASTFPTHRYLNQVLNELKYTTSDGRNYYRNKEIIRYAASKLLKAAGTSCSDGTKEKLKKPFLKILRDPRVTTHRINWEGVDPASIDVMKQWLSARDIEFFFEIVSKTEERLGLNTHWEYRKAFWMAYLPYIEDTWVLMGATAREFATLTINRGDITNTDFGKLSGAESIQSVFFLRVNNVDIVEYSHNGASRIWSQSNSPLQFRRKRIHVNTFRRDAPSHLEKFSHFSSETYGWQRKLSGWLRRNLDIEQKQSYKLY